MQRIKQHIITKILTTVLACLLLTPIITEFTHLFSHHKHDICLNEVSHDHLHELNIDCHFYDYKITSLYDFQLFKHIIFYPIEVSTSVVSQYYFISKFQRQQTFLRGPPYTI